MAYYNLRTQISKGNYKGVRVGELIKHTEGQNYLLKLHIGHYNVFLNPEVFRAMAKYVRTKNGNFVIQHISVALPDHCTFWNKRCDDQICDNGGLCAYDNRQ